MNIPFPIPAPGARPFDVVGFGQNSVDLVAVVAEYPARNSKQRLAQFARLPGGEIATALAVCAKLGWRTRYLGSFGDDDLGRLSRDSLDRAGVDLEMARTVAGAANRFAVILVDERSGDRTVLWSRDPRLATDAASLPRAAVTSGRLLILDSQETAAAARAAQYAREAGLATLLDVEAVGPGIGDLLRHIDAIIAAETFPSQLTGCGETGRALELMAHEFGAPLVCVTLGVEGSLARCGGREIRTPAFQVDCVDSTGAGDAFRGGFAAACLRAPDGAVEDALRYATAVAALNCRGLGARGGLPDAAEVEALFVR
jgi:sulfofructose kinase